jgi:hypothetical protein
VKQSGIFAVSGLLRFARNDEKTIKQTAKPEKPEQSRGIIKNQVKMKKKYLYSQQFACWQMLFMPKSLLKQCC